MLMEDIEKNLRCIWKEEIKQKKISIPITFIGQVESVLKVGSGRGIGTQINITDIIADVLVSPQWEENNWKLLTVSQFTIAFKQEEIWQR